MRALLLCCWLVWLTGCAAFDSNSSNWQQPRQAQAPTSVALAYSVYGTGEPLVLVHGFGASRFSWRYLIAQLSQHYRVYASDLKGFGQTEKPRDDNYNAYDQGWLVSEFIIHQQLKKPMIIGHSFGGAVSLAATLYLQSQPAHRPKKLVLIDSIGYPQELPLFIQLLATPLLGPLVVHSLPNKLQVQMLLEQVYFDHSKIPQQAIAHYAENLSHQNAKYALIKTAKQLLPADIGDFNRQFSSLSQPTLVIASKDDKIVPVWVAKKLAADLPNAQLALLDKVGHAVQEEQPERLLAILREFLPFE